MQNKIITDITFLKKRSEEIFDIEELERIIKNLEDSLDLSKGLGLSAVQIGILKRVGIIRLPKCKLDLVNPKIINKNDKFMYKNESCLSLPGIAINTRRYKQITLENGDGKKYILVGLEAVVVQHEISHMQGRTIIDDKWRKR